MSSPTDIIQNFMSSDHAFSSLSAQERLIFSSYLADTVLASGDIDPNTSRDMLVDFYQAGGADFLKMFSRFPEELQALSDEELAQAFVALAAEETQATPTPLAQKLTAQFKRSDA